MGQICLDLLHQAVISWTERCIRKVEKYNVAIYIYLVVDKQVRRQKKELEWTVTLGTLTE